MGEGVLIATDADRKARMRDIEKAERREEEERQKARKNRDFVQVYPLGWDKLREVIKQNAKAAALYTFLAEHIDGSCGAVICTQDFLATRMDCSVRTVQRCIAFLEKENMITSITLAGNVKAYALNPSLVWRGYATGKDHAAFNAKTLVEKDDEIQKRLKIMMKGKQLSLELDDNLNDE